VARQDAGYGQGWNIGQNVDLLEAGDDLYVRTGDGSKLKYTRSGNVWRTDPRLADSSITATNDGYLETYTGGRRTFKRQEGVIRVVRIEDGNGNRTDYDRSGNTETWSTYLKDSSAPIYLVKVTGSGNRVDIKREGENTGYVLTFSNQRLTEVAYPDGSKWTVEYADPGLVTKITSPIGLVTRYAYFANGAVRGIVNHLNYVTEYKYSGATVEVIDEFESVTETFANGRLTGVAMTGGRVSTWDRDTSGRVTKFTDMFGQETAYTYADQNILPQSIVTADTIFTYAYDTENKVVTVVEANRQDPGQKMTYAYEYQAGRVSSYSITAPGQDPIKAELRHQGDNLTQIKFPGAESLSKLSFNNRGQIVKRTDAFGAEDSFSFDDQSGDLSRIVDAEGGRADLAFDRGARRHSVTDANGTKQEFGFDSLGRLTQARSTKASGEELFSSNKTFGFGMGGLSVRTEETIGAVAAKDETVFVQPWGEINAVQNKDTVQDTSYAFGLTDIPPTLQTAAGAAATCTPQKPPEMPQVSRTYKVSVRYNTCPPTNTTDCISRCLIYVENESGVLLRENATELEAYEDGPFRIVVTTEIQDSVKQCRNTVQVTSEEGTVSHFSFDRKTPDTGGRKLFVAQGVAVHPKP
jgi:YD repeat-containing protein